MAAHKHAAHHPAETRGVKCIFLNQNRRLFDRRVIMAGCLLFHVHIRTETARWWMVVMQTLWEGRVLTGSDGKEEELCSPPATSGSTFSSASLSQRRLNSAGWPAHVGDVMWSQSPAHTSACLINSGAEPLITTFDQTSADRNIFSVAHVLPEMFDVM